MFVLFLVLPGFGFGDVKLSGLLGLVSGLGNTLPALAIGAIAGGVGAALMMVFRRAGRRTTIAYGPYLALGAFIGMLSR
jgi:leader peptidase (prepilin peptidase)/N-methyltransferase